MGWHKLSLLEKTFIGSDSVCLVLGDNIFHGNGFSTLLHEAVHQAEQEGKATVFGYGSAIRKDMGWPNLTETEIA
jgi:dTDP-glucose pyrophosphorylase